MPNSCINGRTLKRRIQAGVDSLAQQVETINQLNVFPVPDGDTGINMYHTLQRAWQEIAELDSEDVSLIADRFAHGALMGARGNSGTILSQLLRGFADGLAQASMLSPAQLRSACQAAVQQAYMSVAEPSEGTILTVAREATASLQRCAGSGVSLKEMLKTLTSAAEVSLDNTPNLLPILKEAGVVDAGGMGLVAFLRGLHCGQTKTPYSRADHSLSAPKAGAAGRYGYDVQFLMLGQRLDMARARRDLEELGWSVIVVGDEQTIKVHIHVDNPAIPLDYAIRMGAVLDDIVVENMDLQSQRTVVGRSTAQASAGHDSFDIAVIAVADGDGMQAVFRDLNCAAVIQGGAGHNPATEDFISAIKQLNSRQIIILPNDRNIFMAAQQAADLIAGKKVTVLRTDTVLQGVSAMLAFGDATDADADLETTLAKMNGASSATSSIEITRASRDSKFRAMNIKQGDHIALLDGMIAAAAADIEAVIVAAFAELDLTEYELATVYFGADVTGLECERLVRRLTMTIKGLEFESVYGGQSLYPYLISVE
ncbi:MAG: DAK2 domain-containing protein [Chloroflexi bacterium]|nr:DAK2 domain-containing protein [Chloroflexota bacterium]